MKTAVTKTTNRIAELADLVKKGLNYLSQAGSIVVDLIEEGYSPRAISDESGFLTVRDVADLERIGRGTMASQLMVFTSPAVNYLKNSPLALQNEVIANGVETLVKDGDKYVKKTLTIPQLSHRQCKMVFKGGKINGIAAQKKILQEVCQPRGANYEIQGNWLVVNRPCSLGKEELKKILKEMA